MNYYLNAEDQLRSANVLFKGGEYRTPIALLFLACELYLKSLLEKTNPDSNYLNTHDIVNIGLSLKTEIDYNYVAPKLAFLRKYHNDSRYPFNPEVYTEDFYNECLSVVLDVKSEIDKANAAKPTKQVLEEKFGKNKVIDTTKNENK